MSRRLDDSWYLCFVAASYYLEWEDFWEDPAWIEQQASQPAEQQLLEEPPELTQVEQDSLASEETPPQQEEEEGEDEMRFRFQRHSLAEEPDATLVTPYEYQPKFKCVSLDLKPTYHEILPLSEFTAEEVDLSWYCHLELESIQAAAMDPSNERNSECHGGFRGLERYNGAASTRLELNRVQVVAAVLREQKRQALWKRKNPLLIAQAASKISQECQELACIQGFNDEMEARGLSITTVTTADNTKGVVCLPKPGLLEGLSLQMTAIREMAFLERLGKPTKK